LLPGNYERNDRKQFAQMTSLQTIGKISTIKQLLDSTVEKVQKYSPKRYKKELAELLFDQPYSKIEFVGNRLNVERKAASRYLQELEKIMH
jgi:Fic family protein